MCLTTAELPFRVTRLARLARENNPDCRIWCKIGVEFRISFVSTTWFSDRLIEKAHLPYQLGPLSGSDQTLWTCRALGARHC